MKAYHTHILIVLFIVYSLLNVQHCDAQLRNQNETSALNPPISKDISMIFKSGAELINKGDYDKAITICKQGISICNNTPEGNLKMSVLYNYIGASFQFKGDFDSAICYFYLAVEKAEHNDSGSLQLMRIYNNMSLTFNRTLNNGKAIFYLEKAEQLALKNNWDNLLPAILLNKGRIYKEEKKFKLSETTFLRALALCDITDGMEKASGMPVSVMKLVIYTNLGQLNLDQNRISQAKKYLDLALPLSADVNPYYQIPVRLALGRVYFKLKDYKRAEENVLIAISKSESSKINDGLAEGHLLISTIYERQTRFEQAYKHLSQAYELEENIRGVDRTENSRLLEVKYRTAQKDKEIAQRKLAVIQKDRLIRNKNIWITSISFGLISLLVFLIVVYKNYNHRQHLQEQKILSIEQNKHIEILKATAEGEEKERNRIAGNLHDGIGSIISAAKMNFSTLHTIASDKLVFERSMNLLNEAAFELRTTAHNLMPQMLLQEGLGSATKDFCERVSNSKLLNIEYQAYGDFQPTEEINFELSVYRIIQELVNNIIKHSAARKALVQLSMSNDLLAITVEDDGNGIAGKDWANGTGLKNMREKVSIFNGMMSIDSTPEKGTQVYIEFELSKTQTKA